MDLAARCGRLEHKVVLVTGGASGIGAATCRLFAEEGAQIVVADIDRSRGKALVDEITNAGRSAVFHYLNTANQQHWQELVGFTDDRFGKLNVLVASAGMSGAAGRSNVESATLGDWERVMGVNSTGIFLGMQAVIPAMRRTGGGSIVNISSIYGIAGSMGGAAYHASKGAVRTITKAAAIQLATDNIRVNSVHPGFTDSAMTTDLHSDPVERAYRLGMTPLGRMGQPIDIAYGILYLASDEAAWVTGSELVIDGGVLAR